LENKVTFRLYLGFCWGMFLKPDISHSTRISYKRCNVVVVGYVFCLFWVVSRTHNRLLHWYTLNRYVIYTV